MTGFRLLVAAACLLLASGRASAQNPSSSHPDPAQNSPGGSNHDARLRAVEEKIERVLKALESREPPGGGIDGARNQVAATLQAKEREYGEFQRNRTNHLAGGTSAALAERIGKLESRRVELTIRLQETADQLQFVEKSFKQDGRKAAQRTIAVLGAYKDSQFVRELSAELARRRKVYGADHPKVQDVQDAIAAVRRVFADGWDVEEFVADAKAEMKKLRTEIETLQGLLELEVNKARTTHAYEVEEGNRRSEIERLRQAVAGLDAVLRGDKPPAK